MFLVEAREHVQALGSGLLELSPSASQAALLPVVEKLFRGAHSLKGAARTINAGEIERLCQKLESLFSHVKSGPGLLSPQTLEELHRLVALLGQRVDTLEAGQPIADCVIGKNSNFRLPNSEFRLRLRSPSALPSPSSMPFSFRRRSSSP